jgi:Helix-turn-helix domain
VKPVAEQTLYEILEVPPDAPECEIVKAWERAEALYGPGSLTTYTLVSPEEAAVMGAKLEEALNVLLDPKERMRYDERIQATPAANGAQHEEPSGTWSEPAALPPIIPPLALVPFYDPSEAEDDGSTAEEPAEAPRADGAERSDPAPILLSKVAAEPEPIPLLTPAPISPPFAALLESPAALAVSPLAAPAKTPEAPRPPAPAPPREAEFVLPEGAAFTGEFLRCAREARGLGIQQVCERTKVARHHLENIEADRYEKLPAPVFLRGILMALARELRLDGQKVARSYLEAAAQAAGKGS